jgi:hypothetical protein
VGHASAHRAGPGETPVSPSAADALRRARFDLRMLLARLPVVYRAVPAWNWARVRDDHALVTRRTELVIDGFPSSGNSYSIAALRTAALDEGATLPAIAHHLHCPGQVLDAVRRGIPTLLLVRRPTDTVTSALSRWPHLRAEQTLRAYVAYHERLLPRVAAMEVATFEQLIGDVGGVVRRVNARFGLSLPILDSARSGRRVYDPDDGTRAARRALAARRREEVESPSLAASRERADALHAAFTSAAAWLPGGPSATT